jgi:transposase
VSHRNARLTFHGRLLIVERHRGGMPKAHIASAMGVSRKCVKKWIDRYDDEGLAGLHDRSSRPHTMPVRTSPEVEAEVVAARAEHREGPDTLGPKVGVPARTVSRILRRHEVPYLRELDPMTGEVIRSWKHTAVRYERDRPGELVHMDVKKLGRIPDVVVEPGRKSCGAVVVAGEDLAVGPLGGQRAVQPFDLSVLPRAVGRMNFCRIWWEAQTSRSDQR